MKFSTQFCYDSSKRKGASTNSFNHSSDIDFQDFMNLYKSVLQSHILFWWFMLLLPQIILHVLKRIFQKEYNN